MQWIDEVSAEGAYGFDQSVRVGQSRRGLWWAEVGGFRWRGNEGGYVTRRFRLTAEDAQGVMILMARVRAGHMVSVSDVAQRVADSVQYEA